MFSRKFAAIAISAGLLLTTAGCSFNPNPDSLQSYAPSDGTGADIDLGAGEVIKLRNFLYLTDGENGTLLGTIANSGTKPQTVTINYTGADGVALKDTIDLIGGGAAGLGYLGAQQSVIKVDGKAGDLATISFGVANNSKWTELNVPVLDATHNHYSELIKSLSVVTPDEDPTVDESVEQ